MLLSAMSVGCSRVALVDDPPVVPGDEDESAGAGEGGDVAEPELVGSPGGAGGAPNEPPATPLVDTGTLSVAVSISAGNADPTKIGQAEAANVELTVTVTERATGAPVSDAEVRGGPPGSLVPMPYDVYSICSYGAGLIGYQPLWEISVVRGSDRFEGLLVAGPAYASAAVSIEPSSGVVSWAPSAEVGVTARVCATTNSGPPTYTAFSQLCVDTVDSGALSLDAQGAGEMFPFAGSYWVVVERFLNQPTSLGDERSVVVYAAMELAL